jgi:hypothetical protein
MKTLLIAIFGVAACAQTVDSNLDAVAAKAKEKAEVTLEGPLLNLALQSASEKTKSAAASLSRLIVRHYEFEKAGEYSDADLEAIRKQASAGAGWSRVMSSKEKDESVDIYMLNQGGKPAGFLLIAAEAKELTIVHAIGSIDLASLKEVVNSTIKYDLKSAAGQ